MKFKIYDSVSYGHMEPLVPFTKIHETNSYKEAKQFIEDHDEPHFIIMGKDILYDPMKMIYESPDNGRTITKRNMLRDNKTKIEFETIPSSSVDIKIGLN